MIYATLAILNQLQLFIGSRKNLHINRALPSYRSTLEHAKTLIWRSLSFFLCTFYDIEINF